MRKPLGNSGIHPPGAFSKGLPHEENLEKDQKQIPAGLTKGSPKMTTAGNQKKDPRMFSNGSQLLSGLKSSVFKGSLMRKPLGKPFVGIPICCFRGFPHEETHEELWVFLMRKPPSGVDPL